ncbi:MAG: hypothetical protein OEW39_07740, partial [Deltaproteobacteria bacterium]|nr:hypothetical protein [Deltaproteobacteria bacterium]
RLSPRQVQVLLEPHARHVRGRKVPDTLVLWPGGFEAQIATGGSELPTLRRNGTRLEEIAWPGTPAALSVWMTGYVRHGGGGLAPRALLHPSQQVSLPPGILPVTVREAVFRLMQTPPDPLPLPCRRWLVSAAAR